MNARTVVVTGGSSGIGLATARNFLDAGDNVTVLDRRPSPLPVPTIIVDLADPQSIHAAAAQLPENIDVLCNVAGVAGTAGSRTVLAVNYLGIRALTEQVIASMTTGGAVVNVASTSGWYWRENITETAKLIQAADPEAAMAALDLAETDGYLAYNRAKEAVVIWTTLAAQQFFGQVRVNSVSPGPIKTPLLDSFYESMGAEELDPLIRLSGRAGTPQEIADIVTFLASPAAQWINGTDITADFGAEAFLAIQEWAPDLVQRTPSA